MKKFFTAVFCCLLTIFVSGCSDSYKVGIPNPWTDCGNDIVCAQKVSGLKVSPELAKYNIRAMKDMIELNFSLDDDEITFRKSAITQAGDISGDYNEYPVVDTLEFKGIEPYFFTRGDKKYIYVVNFEDFGHDYSAISKKGLTSDDVLQIYNIIKSIESSK